MAPQLRSQNHMDESIPLDLAALSDKLARFALDTESSIQASLQARDVRIDKVESKMNELTGMFKAYIDGKRTEEPNGSNSAGQSHLDNLTRVGPTRPSGSDEILGQSDRVNRFSDSPAQNQRVHTPRFDFPSFDGSNPIEWLESCEFYFECYQTGEMYKTRLASMNFHGKAKEWYSCFRIENPNPPWPILVDAISQIHPVFHISQLKKKIGDIPVSSPTLSIIGPVANPEVLPHLILARRMVKRRNAAMAQVLVQWQGQAEEEATWEDYNRIAEKFPDFIREDANFVKGEGMQRGPIELEIIAGNSQLKGGEEEGAAVSKEGQPVILKSVADSGPCELNSSLVIPVTDYGTQEDRNGGKRIVRLEGMILITVSGC